MTLRPTVCTSTMHCHTKLKVHHLAQPHHHSSTYFIEPCLVLGPLEQLICWVAAGLSLHGTPAAEAVNNSIHNTQLSWPPGRFIMICAFLIIIAPCFYPSQLPTTKHLPRCHHHLAKIIIMCILRTLQLLFQTASSANLLPEHTYYIHVRIDVRMCVLQATPHNSLWCALLLLWCPTLTTLLLELLLPLLPVAHLLNSIPCFLICRLSPCFPSLSTSLAPCFISLYNAVYILSPIDLRE